MSSRFVVRTEGAPRAVGHYSQGVVVGDFIFTAGQLPLDVSTGEFVEGDFKDRVRQVLKNLNTILGGAGSSLDCAVKLTVFLTDVSSFGELNQVFSEVFKVDPPARSVVQVSKLPRESDIEIDCIAVRK
ncbi:MAG: Rid family detoxifying hydrolase [Fidelibacterota bacterium]